MKILIIGGTRFVGRAISESLLAHGHSLTLFHRGKTNPDYLPEATHVIGDRETDIERLTGTWDVVIDTCGYYPRIVKISANHLQDKVKHYLFISTISVYSSTSELGITEAAPLQQLDDPTTEDMQSEENAYGGLKVLCENVVTSVYGDRSIIVRPGLIVGPYDPTNRFTYWLPRIRKSGRILAPGDGSMPSQFIDVRDLAEFTVHLAEKGQHGVFNATGPSDPIRLDTLFSIVADTTGSSPDFVWTTDDWLQQNEIGPWMEMPLWIPSPEGRALMSVNVSHSISHGLQYRPVPETIRDTLDWYDSINGDDQEWPAGMDLDKEKTLLDQI